MNELIDIWQRPSSVGAYLIAGWRQWADAGNTSSALPQYLVELLGARKIGRIKPNGFYLFQVPGTHHFLRPEVRLEEGHTKAVETHDNDFYWASTGSTDVLIFLGEEPHLELDRYADAFLDAVEELGVRRVLALGGVFGSMPYDKDREVHCVYSTPGLKDDLANYAVKFSNYEGGSTIGTYLTWRAEQRGIEFVDFYAFVPAYDFSELSSTVQGMRLDNDYRAWYELMRRFNFMADLGIDLSELKRRSEELTTSMDAKIGELDRRMPHLKIKDHMRRMAADFAEMPFMPLDDVWERELGDLLQGFDDLPH